MGKHYKKKEKKERKILIFLFTWIFLFCFVGIVFSAIFFNMNDLVHFRMIRSCIIGATSLGILISIFYLSSKFRNKLVWFNRHFNLLLLLTFLIMFILQVIVAKSTYFNPGWDVGGVIDNSINIVSSPEKFDYNYFMLYPNNLLLLLIFSNIYKLVLNFQFIDFRFILVVINIIMIDIAIWTTLQVIKKLLGKRIVLISYILFSLLFAFSPWMLIPYSDTLSMLFPILIFYLYIKQKELKNKTLRLLLIFNMGILGLIGFQIKPTAIIVLIAIIMGEILYSSISRKEIFRIIGIILILASGVLVAKVGYENFTENIVVNGHNLADREDIEVPFTHFIMMGMQSVHVENRGTIYGAYNEQDINFTISKPTKEEKVSGNIEEIMKRLEIFGVGGYLKFLSNKICWVLSDGTFYYGGEGNFMREEPYSSGYISERMQNVFNTNTKEYYNLANVLQGFWILIIFLIAYPIFSKNKDYDNKYLFIERLTLTGIILFLAFFEGRSRYIINHLPFFILVATYGFKKIYERYLEVICSDDRR